MKQMEEAMPHGKEGFSITLKSGHYSCICVGGRQSTANKSLNGMMGTPNMPIKCTVTIDIDREFNDEHNEAKQTMIVVSCWLVAMRVQCMPMWILSLKVVIWGVLSMELLVILETINNYDGNTYNYLTILMLGRANILIDPRDGAGNNR